MSKHYDAVWDIIESLDAINGNLSDILDDERDRNAKAHLRDAMNRIEEAVAELETLIRTIMMMAHRPRGQSSSGNSFDFEAGA